ncbi:MAG: dTMP kinase, partial [Thaumarchaeota archaeon]|nr:dTMP kinase [Nitrososphaerota archaeon]
YTAEPTGSEVGRILKAMAGRRNVDPRVEAMLFAADRLIHLEKIVKPLLEEGFIVVSDRYLHSSLAYQAASTGDRKWVEELNRYAVKPDLAILLDVAPETGLKRIKRKRSRFERADFLRKVRENYLGYVERGELVRVDAERGVDEVFSDLAEIVESFLEGKL